MSAPASDGLSIDELRARDDAARRIAQTVFDRPLVLEAGAGTGKTSTLVARVVAWCLGPGWDKAAAASAAAGSLPEPDRIATRVLARVVAITFTEAAAAEMATRVAEVLAALACAAPATGVLPEALPAASDERQARARALLAALDHLVVRTIHAFCRRLLATYPLEARVHPSFEVDADGAVQAEVVREILEAKLRYAYAAPGEPLFLALAERGIGPAEMEAALAVLVEAGVPPSVLAADPFPPERVRTMIVRLRDQLAAVHRLEAGRLRALSRNSRTSQTVESIDASLAYVRTRAEGLSLQAVITRLRELWPAAAVEHLGKWAKSKFGATESNALAGDATALAECAATLRRSLVHLVELDPGLLNDGRGALIPLLDDIGRRLRARGAVTFGDLLRNAHALLTDRPAVAAQVRDGIDQLLVDEFQDTDHIQCGVIQALALEGPTERRPGLLLVGDPKQSIYGWRSADLRAYDDFVEQVRQHGGSVHELVVNFRSVPPILDEVERLVAPVMRQRIGVQPKFQPLVPCAARAGAHGFAHDRWAPVEYWVSWETDDAGGDTGSADATAVEAAALARDLATLHREHGVAWHDVGVLLRSTSDLDTYLGALRAAGVPYAVERDKSYFLRREIIEVSALVGCILDPADHLALLTVLRSALVGVPDAALIPLWSRGFPALVTELHDDSPAQLDRLAAVITAAVGAVPDDVPGIGRVRGWEHNLFAAVRHLGVLRASFAVDPADVFVEQLRTLFLVEATEAARFLGAYRIANLDRFFRRLQMALQRAGGDAHTVLRRLRTSVAEAREAEEGRPAAAAVGAVQVMTIHKAKGLDFAHVYVMQLHKESKVTERPSHDAAEIDGRVEYRLFGAATLGYDAVEAHREEVEAAERVRTLYVATTRAKERLVLAGRWPRTGAAVDPNRARSHMDLLQLRRPAVPLLHELGAGLGAPRHYADAAATRWVFPAHAPDTMEPLRPPSDAAQTLPTAAQVSAVAERLRAACLAAEARQARPFHGAASEEAHAALRELLAQQRYRADGPVDAVMREPGITGDASQRIAMAVGTAVHRALETFDLAADVRTESQRQHARLGDVLRTLLAPEEHDVARRRADELWERFRRGPLFERFQRLAPHIIARELPVLVPPAADGTGPVGVIAGAVDLLYRDPPSGEWVVADYKTDAVHTDAEVAERMRAYATQGELYTRAVGEALALEAPPRFELWFLHAGRIEVVGILTRGTPPARRRRPPRRGDRAR